MNFHEAFHICGDFVGRLIEYELIFFVASKFVSVSFIISFLLPPLPNDTFCIVNSYSFLFLFHFCTLFGSLLYSKWINKLYTFFSPFFVYHSSSILNELPRLSSACRLMLQLHRHWFVEISGIDKSSSSCNNELDCEFLQ